MASHDLTIRTALQLALAFGAAAPGSADAARPTPTQAPRRPMVQVVRVSTRGGFDWGDAGIGAAGGIGLVLVVGGGVVVLSADRRRPPQAFISTREQR